MQDFLQILPPTVLPDPTERSRASWRALPALKETHLIEFRGELHLEMDLVVILAHTIYTLRSDFNIATRTFYLKPLSRQRQERPTAEFAEPSHDNTESRSKQFLEMP
jgi:hypothetical protein